MSPRLARLDLKRPGADGPAVVRELVIAGWTGRDADAVERHIAELEKIGVSRPATVPCYYRVSASLLTTADEVDVVGPNTSGEAEAVLLSLADGLWVGVGSDHTDRHSETFDVAVSKQACAKPVGATVWRYSDVAGHWDRLILRSHALRPSGRRHLYQEGPLAKIRRPEDLIAGYLGRSGALPPGTAMFCGTLAAVAALESSIGFEVEIEDPVLERRISHYYTIHPLPVTRST
jgi:hypothetical protein